MKLRERQKDARYDRILSSAKEIFIGKGFIDTSIADIAEASDVSSRTVYNYFKSKEHILLALFKRHTDNWLAHAETLMATLPEHPAEALTFLLWQEIDIAVEQIDNLQLWQSLITISIVYHGNDAEEGVFHLAKRQSQPIENALRMLVERGKVRADIDLEETAWMLYSVSRAVFRDLVSNTGMDLDEAKGLIRRHIGRIYRGLTPSAGG